MLKKELLAFAQQRKLQYEDGEPFHFHSLKTAEEATALVEAAEKEVEEATKEVSSTGRQTAIQSVVKEGVERGGAHDAPCSNP